VTGIENWDMHAGGGPLAEPMIMWSRSIFPSSVREYVFSNRNMQGTDQPMREMKHRQDSSNGITCKWESNKNQIIFFVWNTYLRVGL
jgi:hypothetical protein